MVETAFRHASVGVRCELVWTGVKCNFSSAQHHAQYVIGKVSIKFHQDMTEKVTAFHNSSTKGVACDHLQKGVNYHFPSPQLDKPYVVLKLSISEA